MVGLSVPFRPRGERAPLGALRAARGENFYQIYFQKPGLAEADLERDVRGTVREALYGASGDHPTVPDMLVRGGGGFLGEVAVPDRLPDWLRDEDVDFYTAEFTRTGFRGGLNWYRNIDRNWELTAPWHGLPVTVPAAYMVGDRDVVYHFPGSPELIANLERFVPDLKRKVILEGCGHWIQQERPKAVNALLVDFLRGL